MMDATWTSSNPTGLNTARNFSRSWYSNSRFSFWWVFTNIIQAATEEYDGTLLGQLLLEV
jgi:hypothetical protein